jgi:multicomponent Na+:H+ antiporter subunit A
LSSPLAAWRKSTGSRPPRSISRLDGILKLAAFLTGWIQHGQLRVYVRVTLIAASGLILYATAKAFRSSTDLQGAARNFRNDGGGGDGRFGVGGGALAAAWRRFSASAVSAIRWPSCFVAYGAPDLAITQLLVETLTVVLFSFVILKLPQIRESPAARTRWDALIATIAGLAMTLVVWKAVHVQVTSRSPPAGRALRHRGLRPQCGQRDPGGLPRARHAREILVLSLACLGVTALLFRKRKLRITDDSTASAPPRARCPVPSDHPCP